mmetsp:Transcript_6930/g.7176  ORF Transcript_6930/g.7176 Transcript_6930/m.7176 type:complete len:287 (-) Transcript_6930:1462-2322(-)
MNSSNKRRKRTQIKEEVELDFELESSDKLDFFKCLRELYTKRTLCDIVFEVNDGSRFEAHKVVLAASNGFLGALIRSGLQDSDRRVFHIKEEGVLFKLCLDFLYGLPICIESSQVIPLLGLANAYSMISLRDQLADSLEMNLSVENCCAIFAAADAYGCLQLREYAVSRLFNNFALASKTPSFCDLPVNLLIYTLSSDNIMDCDEAVVFEAATRWLEGNHVMTSVSSPVTSSTVIVTSSGGVMTSSKPNNNNNNNTHSHSHSGFTGSSSIGEREREREAVSVSGAM